MKIQQNIKDAINDRSEDIFRAYGVELKKGAGVCPFHEDEHPSFIAKPDNSGRWKWKCLACDKKGGDIFAFVAEAENLNPRTDFVEVAKRAAALCGLSYLLPDDDGEQTGRPTTPMPRPIAAPRKTEPEKPPRYFNAEIESMAQEIEQTNLYKYLCRVWEAAEVRRAMAAYKVGRGHYINAPQSKFNASEDWRMNPNPCRLQNSTACSSFPSIDIAGNCHAIKIAPYPSTDHHRIKDAQPDKATFYWTKPEQNEGAYFGTHLLPLRPAAPVAVVESEKTALIGFLFAPAYVWIATQSKGLLSPNSASVEALKGRELHLFPDADGLQAWGEIAAQLRAHGFKVIFRDEVIKLLPAESKADIADVIIWEMERRANDGN